jgi:hypothetical protein
VVSAFASYGATRKFFVIFALSAVDESVFICVHPWLNPLRSFLLKNQFVTLGHYLDFIPRLELAFEQFHGQWVEQLFPPSPSTPAGVGLPAEETYCQR